MNKENCTKGPVTAKPFLTPDQDEDPMMVYKVEGGDLQRRFDNLPMDENGECDEAQADAIHDENNANAELIAEAFNVLAETGMTPRELADAVKELRSAVANLSNGAAVCFDDLKRSGYIAKANGQDYRKAEYEAQLVHAKYQPVTT